MNEAQWAEVDRYLGNALLAEDEVLSKVLALNAASGLPAIDVSPLQGKFLGLIATLSGARRVLEIGTLGAYSTIWLARALPADGRIITMELEERHALVAKRNLETAGFTAKVDVRVGPALESLDRLKAEKPAPFDLVFIDADKPNTFPYFQKAIELCRPGSVIVADNVVRKGEVANAKSDDVNVRGMRLFIDALAKDTRVDASALQTVGLKGYDGFILARVK